MKSSKYSKWSTPLICIGMMLIIFSMRDDLWTWSYWLKSGSALALLVTALVLALVELQKKNKAKESAIEDNNAE